MSRVGRVVSGSTARLSGGREAFILAETHLHLSAILELMARERIVAKDWNLIRNCCLSSMKSWMLPQIRANKNSMIP
jgi:hypothetical protein